MRKTILVALFAAAMPAAAYDMIDLNGTTYRSDTLEHFYIGPGMTHTHLLLTTPGRNIDVVVATLDKNDPSYLPIAKPRVAIGVDRARTTETTSGMATRKSGGDRQYLAGINGDFFNMIDPKLPNAGWPVNATIIDGKIASPTTYSSSHYRGFIVADEGLFIDDTNRFSNILRSVDGSKTAVIDAVNHHNIRYANDRLFAFNNYMEADRTISDAGDRDLILTIVDGYEWAINRPMRFKVAQAWKPGSSEIPKDGMVLTATPDYHNEWLESLAPGDEVEFEINYTMPDYGSRKPAVQHMVSGDVRVLVDGKTATDAPSKWYGSMDYIYPMSVAGYSEDQSKIVFITISRNGPNNSTGMTYREEGDMMRYLGCHNAVNFDGGGSATMYIAPVGVVSHLLYDVERPVGNGLFMAIDAPVDNEVASIRFSVPVAKLATFDTYTPTIFGYNKYGQLIDMDFKGAEFTGPDGITVYGNVIVPEKPGTYTVQARIGDMTATIPVCVEANPVTPLYSDILIDGTAKATPSLVSTADGKVKRIESKLFSWTSSNPGVLAIDAETGLMTGIANGSATVTGTRGDFSASINVTVEIASSEFITLDNNFGDASWTITQDGISAASVVKNEDSWLINYNADRKRGLKLTFDKETALYSMPARLGIEISSENTPMSTVKLAVSPRGAAEALILDPETPANLGGNLIFDLAKAFDINDIYNYPVIFHSIELGPQANTTGANENHLLIKNFGCYYDHYQTSVADVAVDNRGTGLVLSVAGSMVLAPAGTEALELYTIDGKLAAYTAGNSIAAPTPGLYIVRARTGNRNLAAKVFVR